MLMLKELLYSAVILGMSANPEPDDQISATTRECTVLKTYPNRPDILH